MYGVHQLEYEYCLEELEGGGERPNKVAAILKKTLNALDQW
jgi:hypothetical protein